MKKGFTYDCIEVYASSMSEKIPATSILLTSLKPGVAIKTSTLQTEEETPSASYDYDVKQLAFFLKYNSDVKLQLTDYYIPPVIDTTAIDSTIIATTPVEPSATILYKLYQELLANGIDGTRLIYRREESDKEAYSIKVQ